MNPSSQAPAADDTLEAAVFAHVMRVYRDCGRVKGVAAGRLGISLKTLYTKLRLWVDAGRITRAEANLR